MKTLSVHQPWASMIVKGIKNIENRTWKTDYRGKILIHAGNTKVPNNIYGSIPGELYNALQNETLYGNLDGNLGKLPTGAIIGYVELKEILEPGVEFECATYDDGPEFYRWVLAEAYEFDEPIPAKGKLNLYDTPEITEDNLPPAHKVQLKVPYYKSEDRTLFAPIASDFYEHVLSGELRQYNIFTQWDMDYFHELVCEEEVFCFPVDTIVFFTEDNEECGRYVGFEVTEHGLFGASDSNGETIQQEYIHPDKDGYYIYDRTAYVVFCGKEVNVDKYFNPETPTPVPERYED